MAPPLRTIISLSSLSLLFQKSAVFFLLSAHVACSFAERYSPSGNEAGERERDDSIGVEEREIPRVFQLKRESSQRISSLACSVFGVGLISE